MDTSLDHRRTAAVKQWKRELEGLRSQIGRQHDQVIERMRDDETHLLEALYSVAESNCRRLAKPRPGAAPISERLATLEHCLYRIARRARSAPTG